MKIPEPLFVIVNPLVKLLLHSPLHALMSRSVLVITFTGRKSGRQFSTPVRYVRDGATIRCFSSNAAVWWRNLQGGAPVSLRVGGKDVRCQGRVLEAPNDEKAALLRAYLNEFPADSVYHDVRLNRDKTPIEADIQAAAEVVAIVEMDAN